MAEVSGEGLVFFATLPFYEGRLTHSILRVPCRESSLLVG